MPATGLHPTVAAYLRTLTAPATSDVCDADLLARFANTRDEATFAVLVRRHGGMVLDVCRSVLGNEADAEDAFQATFLILARNAGSVRKTASVAAWLYGVASRIARKARVAAVRRRVCEATVPRPAAVDPDDLSWREVRRIVHEELAALPERYRSPLVLCHLDGLTHDQAATALGLSKAAVKKRLERGRDKLRAALTRRGLGPTAALAALTVSPPISAALAATAARITTGGATVPAHILILARGGMPMTLGKLAAGFGLIPVVWCAVALAGGSALPAEPATESADPVSVAGVKKSKELPAAKETATLDGEWHVTHVETGGEALFSKNELKDARIVFRDGRAEVKGLVVPFVRDFTYKLDPTTHHKQIDVTFLAGPREGDTAEGIYVVRPDEARLCLRLTSRQLGRPKGFVTNGGTTLFTFILTPAGKPTPPPAVGPVPVKGKDVEPPPGPKFDAVLRSGKSLYFVLTRSDGWEFRDSMAEVGRRLDSALAVADKSADRDVSLVFFIRNRPTFTVGTYTGFTAKQAREIAALPAGKRTDRLLEHAWTFGALPNDAKPVTEEPSGGKVTPPATADKAASAAKAPAVPVLTVKELGDLLFSEKGGPDRANGRTVAFTSTILSISKGVDGGTVPFVQIEGWDRDSTIYGKVYVHNVIPDFVGKVGDRVKIEGMIVAHGYGTLTLWCNHWVKQTIR